MQPLRSLISGVKTGCRVFWPTCRQISRLQSDAVDRPLSLPERFGLRFHLLVCSWCRRYGRQIRFLRRAAHEHSEELIDTTPRKLSPEARERLRRSLNNEAK